MPLSSLFFCNFFIVCIVSIFFLTACKTKTVCIIEEDSCLQRAHSVEEKYPPIPQISLIKPTQGKGISSEFGMRRHPIKKRILLHTGIDISGNRGDRVVASANGIVVFSGRRGSYGLMIDLDIGDGIILRYAHLDKLQAKKGSYVTQGQCIGRLGRTGRTTAPHLHFEVRLHNVPLDPIQFIEQSHHWAIKPQPTLQQKSQQNM